MNRVRRDGLLVIDKPAGLTSTQALGQAKHRLQARKGGHTGTLDPLATGVLVLCFGEATKAAPFLIDADKRYRVTVGLGVATTTYDAEGAVVERRPVAVTAAAVQVALASFVGTIAQFPPRYSAIRADGQRFYERARRGDLTVPPVRSVRIDAIRLITLTGAELVLEVDCGKGVYVRSLAHDLGQVLGCGGHVTALRRLAVGGFTVDRAMALTDIGPQTPLLPSDEALAALPMVRLPPLLARAACHGQVVHPDCRSTIGWARLYADDGRFLGIGWAQQDGAIQPRRIWDRGVQVEPADGGG